MPRDIKSLTNFPASLELRLPEEVSVFFSNRTPTLDHNGIPALHTLSPWAPDCLTGPGGPSSPLCLSEKPPFLQGTCAFRKPTSSSPAHYSAPQNPEHFPDCPSTDCPCLHPTGQWSCNLRGPNIWTIRPDGDVTSGACPQIFTLCLWPLPADER